VDREWKLSRSCFEVLPERLDAGVYLAVIHFGPESLRVTTPPTRLAFRPPTTREFEVRAEVADQVEARGSWGQWTRLPPPPGSQLRLPWGPDDPLRLNWILKDLYFGHDRLPDMPLDRLDVLEDLFAAEREALRAELLAVRHDTAAFERQVQKVKREYPGLTVWMEAIVAGESEIAWTRGQRGSP
jgi:hypothetical protein